MQPGIIAPHAAVLPKLACPICLGHLAPREDTLCCPCGAVYPVIDGVPVFLVEDAHGAIKRDEIAGEVAYNVAIPMSVHEARNVLVDGNTKDFLRDAGVNLTGKEVLVVGCSMSEMLLCCALGSRPVGLDIGPRLVLDCDVASRKHYALDVGWVCGDGEWLPFADSSFDAVIVRQALHHMTRYRTAIVEFLRVTRDLVLIVDEAFVAGDFDSADDPMREYRSGESAEALLADKYHDFTLPACLSVLNQARATYTLHWPSQIGAVANDPIRFVTAPNPYLALKIQQRMTSGGNVSIAASKHGAVVRRSPPSAVRPMSRESVMVML
jgi:ubiquinone/menaquinone biosynthesis C-methylase UbiE/uncharacterized protein YbaR (Trm112 family)